MNRSERSSVQRKKKDGNFSADYCDVRPIIFYFQKTKDNALSAKVYIGAAKTFCG